VTAALDESISHLDPVEFGADVAQDPALDLNCAI